MIPVPPALRHRDFRRFWAGIVVSLSGWFLGLVVRGWVVHELTPSPFWLGAVYAAAASRSSCSRRSRAPWSTASTGRRLLAATLALQGALALALAATLAASLALVAVLGVLESVYTTVNATLVQRATADAYRGRVTSVYNVMWGLAPIGGLTVRAAAARVGPAGALALHGSLLAIAVGLVAVARPGVRRME
jgi:hypothetical protein